ncbi:Amino acid adenylation [Xenorhabdus szentirmaii]|nr:Amino acid adenylation [Xenorhabdus szentirmaii]
MVVGLLAILKAGGAYVPLDPAYPAERLAHILKDSAPKAVLTQTDLLDALSHIMSTSEHPLASAPPVIALDEIALNDPASSLALLPDDNPDTQALGLTPHHLAYVLYTSGSTGLPKGVEMPLSSLSNLLQWHNQTISGNSPASHPSGTGRTLQFAALGFDVAFQEIFTTLGEGGCLILINEEMRQDPHQLLSLIRQKQIDRIFLPYIALQNLAETATERIKNNSTENDFSCLSHIVTAGEQLRITPAIRQFLQHAGNCRLHNHYGPTESHVVTTYTLDEDIEHWAALPPIGRPIANNQIYILDQGKQPVPPGVTGEIYIAGSGVARGYLNRPELTAERFLPDPFAANPDARMYKTGDLGRWLPDGNIEYLGRNDFQIKLRGFRVEPGEIEFQLLQCHGVREAVVVARTDGNTGQKLIAYLLPQDGVKLVPAELRQQLSRHLAEYMLPSAFVILDAFPLTPSGKLNRQALPAPDISAMATRSYEAPAGKIETTLAQIWQDLLGVERIGRHDHFFELGGHSLLAIQLCARVRQSLARVVSLRQLFENPILMELAQVLSEITEISRIVIHPADRRQPQPLSLFQQRLWFLSQLDPAANLAYQIPVTLRLSGQLNRHALISALDRLVARHESLRTRFISIQARPYQYIAPADTRFSLSCHDLHQSDPALQAEHIAEFAVIESRRPFDLTQGPLIRGQLLQLAETEHVLLLNQHHMISDGWSIGILVRELGMLYHAILNDENDPLPPLPVQYIDYAIWQRKELLPDSTLTTPVFTAQREFWLEQLADAPALLSLPTDRPRPATQTYAGHYLPFRLGPGLLEALKTLGQRHHTTLFMTLLAAWSIVLARLSGQDDVVIGTPVANRTHHELEGIVGPFINTLALRIKLSDELNVADLLAQVRKQALAAYANQDLPFEQVVEALQPERNLSYSPIFQVMLTLDNTPIQEQMPSGLQISREEQAYYTTHCDLMLLLTETDAGVSGGLQYAIDLFDAATAERMLGYLTHVLAEMVADDTQAAAFLPIMPGSERNQLLTAFNDTQADFPHDALIHQLFEAQAAQHPSATALIFGDQALSYDELNRRANRLAHYLITQGVRPDSRVAICVERSPDMVIGLLGILKAGGAYVPLDPTYPTKRLAHMLKDSAPNVVLTQTDKLDALSEIIAESESQMTALPSVIVLDDPNPSLAQQPDDNPDIPELGLTPHHLAYVLYTSGSTGLPKGVMVEHINVVNLLCSMQGILHITTDDTMLASTTIGFDIAGLELYLPLISGNRLVLAPSKAIQNPQKLATLITAHNIKIVQATPSAWRILLASGWADTTIKAISGGEALPYELAQRLKAKTHSLWNLYGPTETTIWSTASANLSIKQENERPQCQITIGRPIANTQIYILDKYNQPVAIGETGELHIGGTGVARGYLNRPDLTNERFLRDPFSSSPSARMYKTGDLGRWLPDGNIEYLGRNDFQVKVRGFRIELGEIEAKLMEYHGVREAVVLARPDESGQQNLVAYSQPHTGIELTPAELRQYLTQHLSDSMLPGAYVILENFPLTPNGKLDRQALPAPDASAVVMHRYEAPEGETETALAQIWQKLLKLERVGRHDHFFELGGHSLIAIQLIAHIRQDMARELSLQQLFDQPVLLSLARTLTELPVTNQITIPVADRNQQLPLSFAQQRLWFLCQIDQAASLAYNIPFALRLTSQLNHLALSGALDSLVARHEILRTRFAVVAGHPYQHIAPADSGFTLSHQDLRSLAPETQTQRVEELTVLEAQTPFDFTQGPLIRGKLLQLADEEHVLLITQHHMISDGWSVGVLMHELSALYHAALDGRENPLAPLPVQYADYALWQREQLQKTSITEQRNFWHGQLEGAPDLLTLPTDFPRPAMQSFAGGLIPVCFDADLLASLKAFGQRHNTTLFMTVLGAWSIVLARLSGQDDIVIGTPVANRPYQELEGLIGFFVNTLALRVRFNDSDTVTDLLRQIRKQTLATYAHQNLPFEQVVEALQSERSLSYNPIFQVMLILNNTPAHTSELPDLQFTSVGQAYRSTHFDVTLSLTETASGLAGELIYATDLFKAETAERMLGYLTHVLAEMVADDTQAVALLPIMPESERNRLLTVFNDTQADFPHDALIHQLFEAQAAQSPSATALVCGDRTLSYDELNRQANRLAHYLIKQGVCPDSRVAICVERSPDMVIGLLGILKAGGAYVPLDPAYPTERLAYMLEDANPIVLLTQTALSDKLNTAISTVLLDRVLYPQEPFTAAQPERNSDTNNSDTNNPDSQTLGLTSQHLAYTIYTSGSTGLPKGVAIAHRNTVNFLTWAQRTFKPEELAHTLFATSLNFDLAVFECLAPLFSGGTVHLVPDVLSLIAQKSGVPEQSVSLINTVPSAISQLIESNAVPASVRAVNLAGEALKSHIVDRLFTHTAVQQVCNLYGPSETTTYSTWTRMTPETGFVSHIGRPIANTRIYILDRHGQPAPIGVVGEIYIAGEGVARGYLNRPELTAERFLVDPFSQETGARMYKTGDLGRWLSDGNIEYLGRNDFQVKIRGFRIELGEIEAQLMRCHNVQEAVVIVREDASNENPAALKQLVAYLRSKNGLELIPAELRRQLSQHLAEYMLPSAFVTLDTFPLTANGKLDRQALPAPDAFAVITRHYEKPLHEVEIILAQIWQELLQRDRISRHDHFFELGGHSLLLVSLIERLYSFGWKLDIRSVFSTPILSDMARAIKENIDTSVVPPNRIPADCTAITPDMLPLVSLTQTEIDTIVAATPGGAGNIQDIYPLAPLQEGVLYHHLRQAQGDTYLLQCLLAFDSRQRLDGFLSAFQQVINRHDILRTATCWQGLIQPVQIVWRQVQLNINTFVPDSDDDVLSRLKAHTDPRRHRLDLSQAPLFVADTAYDPARGEWLLALRFHHLVCDHMTLELIFAEIAQIQHGNAETDENTNTLPAALPYRNFIAQLLSVPADKHEAYFRAQLADIDTPTAPFGILSMQNENEAIAEARLSVEPALAKIVRAQARHLGVSPGVLFHVAWAQVLAKTSGSNNVVFGSVLLGRLQGGAGTSRTMGMFINTLPIRIPLADRTVQDVVQATYHTLTTLLEHEQAPLAMAQRCSNVPQSVPLFSAVLNYRHTRLNETDVIDLHQEGISVISAQERTNYPITLSVDDTGIGFRLTAQSVTSIDPARIISYLETTIRGLVDALAHKPQQLIQEITVLPVSERQQLLADFNDTQADFPQHALIHQLFEAQAAQHPHATALVFGNQSLSYAELNGRANRLAHHLINLGVRPDSRVAICLERHPDLIIGLLAILKAGGAYLPLDPAYPAERLAHILKDAEPVVLLTQTPHAGKLDSAIPTFLLDAHEPFLPEQPSHNPDAQALALTSRHLAYVIYTSGSTGLPKGVMVEHRNVLRLIVNSGFAELGQDDCVAHCANIAFDASTWEIWSALLNGGRLHLVSQSELLDPVRFRDSLIQGQVTALWLTSGLFNEYLNTLTPLFGQLRYLLIGGDVIDPRKIRQVQQAESQPAHLLNAYGPTETTTFATMYGITSPVDAIHAIPIGRPIGNTRIYLLDPQGQPVPQGVTGEIYIAGAGVARGYLNRPELTAERFLADPFSLDANERMYKTGDLGRWLPDGNLEYLGRNDFQVKLRGFRIELGEIEAKLMEHHGVREAVVLARPDESGQKHLVAYLQPHTGIELTPAELRQYLAQHLADYMLPGAFVILAHFPLTPNGKLDRQALPAPDASAVVMQRYEAPEGETELALARIWQKLLKLEHIGRHDHFFELGGHSLLAIQLIAHIRQDMARELSLQQLFDHPVLLDLAKTLTETSVTDQITIAIADRDQRLPLSFAQQRLWFLSQLDQAASLAYHIPIALRLTGQLSHSALSGALDSLVARQEILRTRFVLVAGHPYQHIDPADTGFTLSYQDLRPLAPETQTYRVEGLTVLEAQTPFDFTQGPLIRGHLLQLADNEHVLLLTQHHIISDGWSVGILMHELSVLYRAALDGREDPLAPLPVQYADYALWQREQLQKTSITEQRDFWHAQLAGAPALLTLPTDRPRPATQSFAGGLIPVRLEADLLASLKALGQRHNTTLFMTVLGAWSIVLARLSGQDDIVIGTPIANRPHHELESVIGFFVNTLALRVKFHHAKNVTDLLTHVRQQALAAYAHQDLPFEQVVEALQPERDLSYSPIFQVMLALNNTPAEKPVLPELQLSLVEQAHRSAHFDLILSLTETESGLTGDLTYSSDLFDAATAERLAGYLVNVLTAMAADETQPLATLPMLPGSERQQLLVDFNDTQADFPQGTLVHQLFEAQALHCPDATAVVFEGQQLSYAELNRLANRLAHYLIAQGVRPDSRVAVCTERTPQMVIGLLATLKAGGTYVPLDPAYPAERLVYMLDDAAPVILLTQTEWKDKLSTALSTTFSTVLLDNDEQLWASQPADNPDPQDLGLTPRHLAYVIYTSGSTGQPKGVMIEHQNLCNLMTTQQSRLALTPDSRILQFASNSFDACIWECCMAFQSGGRLYLAKRADILPGERLSAYLSDNLISHVLLSPTALAVMDSLPETLHTLLVGGEACPPTLVKRWAQGRQMLNAYGPTEITVCATLYSCHHAEDNPPPIGRPIANTQIYILDAHGQPVPRGVIGEIYIAGAGVARGYLNRPELTAERFLADPFSTSPDARMYKTGDLGRWLPDGNIEYLGRNDFQIKLRGFRIELGEIEARLRQCHGVREAVVLAREDRETQQKRLVAYLLPQAGAGLEPAKLRQQLARHLAEHMLPGAFVTLDAFPLTPNGKLDQQALPEPALSAIVARDHEPPTGEAEISLAHIWQKLLGVKLIGRHDHFFELGGHSLMIVSLIEELRSIGRQLDVRSVFAAPVLADMAQAIQHETDTFVVPANLIPDNCTAIAPDMLPLVSLSQTEIDAIVATVSGGASNVQDIYPLAPLQEGILFHHLLQTQGDDYLLRVLLAFNTRDQLEGILNALQQVIDRHDILRTSAYWQDLAQPVQVVWRQATLSVNVFMPDSGDDILSQLQAHTDPRLHRINLNQAPLFTADIAHDTLQDEWLLALRFHHLVSDHITLDLIFAEMALILKGNGLKRAELQGTAQALPATQPYRNFIAQTLNASPSVHEAYFREQLSGIHEPTAPFGIFTLPKEAPKQGTSTSISQSVARHRILLPSELSDAVRLQARHLGISPSVLFHIAWAQVLAQTSGHNDVVFGSVLLGRLQGGAGADRILGMFINTLPVRISLNGRNARDTVQQAYQDLTALLEHEQAPLALAQRCSDVAQPMPLFSTLLNYRHSQAAKGQTGDAVNAMWADVRFLSAEERTSYPITLSVDDLGQDFQLTALTVADIVPEQITTYLATAIKGLIDALTCEPNKLILDIPILPETERQKLLVDFNATRTDFPQDALIHQRVEDQVLQRPDATAVIHEGQRLSYNELNQRANRLAHHLIALGVRPDARVAICLERSPEMVIGLLAILKAGGAYVPLDPSYPAERLAYMFEDAAPMALLIQTTWADKFAGILPATLPTVLLDNALHEPDAFLPAESNENPDIQALGLTSRHLAYVIYTSGSTGQPKGVMVEHRNVLRLVINNNFADIGPNDCIAHCANVSFDAATWEVWGALVQGARILLIPEKSLLQPDDFGEHLTKAGASALFLTTALFNQYANLIAPALSGLRYILFGGEKTDTRAAIRLRSEHSPDHLLHVYGPTETTTFATAYEIPLMENDETERSIPIGHPIANTQAYILDEKGQPVPVGVAGEIYIAGDGVARGYLNRPELTAERFLTDPFSPGPEARMYKTGDLGRWLPDGNIEYLSRNDSQVKLRGFRIELGEIETRLRQCHGVSEALVLIRGDMANGNTGEQKRLVAYLRPQAGTKLIPAELRQQLAQHLADYMLPSAFVMLESFPLTPNGKLDRQALPAPDASAVVSRHYEAPAGETEIALARIWQDLLGLERVGRHDHFFELGGHSLLAVQLASRIRQVLAKELSLQQLFDHPLLANLAHALTDASVTSQATIPVADRHQPLPLSFAQQRLWFLGQLDPAASLAYHIPAALRLSGQLNHPALSGALDRLVARQEILRTRFVLNGGQPCQHIDPADTGFTLSYHDLRPLAPETQTHRVGELTVLEAQTPFDFTQGPLIRGHLLQLADEEHILLITQHHIISDGWSIGVLMHELGLLYSAELTGQDPCLPPLPVQYADYAVWQRHWLQETTLTAQRDFWCKALSGAPALLTLPTDRPRPAVHSYVGNRIPVCFGADLLAPLKALGQRHNTTLFMTVLGAWSIVLARLSGQDDIVIGTPVANRPHHELEGMIGFFVNTLALRIRFSHELSVADLLTHVKDQAFAAYANQDLPFEQVVEALQPERSLSYSPVFQVMLSLNNMPAQTLTLPDLQLIPMEQEHHSAHFDLTLSLTETEGGLVGELAYAVDLFDSSSVERMVGYLGHVLTAMVTNETQAVATLPMLPESERQQLLTGFNRPRMGFPQDRLIHQLFEAQATARPDAVAVVWEGQTLSYGELNRCANRLAHHLMEQGVRPDTRVAICVERGLEMVVGLLAILKAGGAYVPLDPAYPADRLAYTLEDAAPVALLTQSEWLNKLADALSDVALPTTLLDKLLDRQDPLLATQSSENPDVQALGLTPHHLAYIIYTSGSTGQPKGVMVEHANITRLFAATQARFQFDNHDVWTLFHSFAFDFSVWELWGALAYGGRLVVIPADCARSPRCSIRCYAVNK